MQECQKVSGYCVRGTPSILNKHLGMLQEMGKGWWVLVFYLDVPGY